MRKDSRGRRGGRRAACLRIVAMEGQGVVVCDEADVVGHLGALGRRGGVGGGLRAMPDCDPLALVVADVHSAVRVAATGCAAAARDAATYGSVGVWVGTIVLLLLIIIIVVVVK